jgi:hypothetical protein
MEEAGAAVTDLTPYTLFNLAFVNQVYLMFRGRLVDGRFQPGSESLDVRLFPEADIPWDRIAFTVIWKTLQRYFQDRPGNRFPFYLGDIERPGSPIANSDRCPRVSPPDFSKPAVDDTIPPDAGRAPLDSKSGSK